MKYIAKLLLYIAFISIGNTIAKANPQHALIYYGLTFIVVIANLFYDYLKYLLNTIMKRISNAQDIGTTYKIIAVLERSDLFKGLTNSLIIPRILLAIDANEPVEVLNLLKEHEFFLRSKPDYLLIYRYGLFKAHCLSKNTKEALVAYSLLLKLQKHNVKSKKMRLLFNWQQIDALHLFLLKKYKQANLRFTSIDTQYFNNREKLHLYYEQACTYHKLKLIEQRDYALSAIADISPTSPFLAEADAW